MDGLYEQFRIALHQVWRRRWLAVGVAWGIAVLGWLVLALIPSGYESKARVLLQSPNLLSNTIGINPADRQGDLFRIKQTLTSSANLEKIVRRTDLNTLVASERDLAAQVSALRESIKITAQIDNPNLFEISATSGVSGFSNAQNARTAQGVAQGLLDLLVEGELAGDRRTTSQAIGLLDTELKRLEGQLQQADAARVAFEQKFMGALPGDGSIASRMSAARSELSMIDQQLIVAQSSLAALRSQLSSTPSSISTAAYGAAGVASGQIAQLEMQLSQMQGRGWTDAHPDIISMKQEIARLRPQAANERSGGGAFSTPNPAYGSLRAMAAEKEAQVAAAQARKNQLQAGLSELDAQQTGEPGVVSEQARRNRDYDVLKRQYDKLLEDREQLRLRSDVQTKTDAMQFRIIDPASAPTVPATPNRPLLLSAILLIALVAGAGAAFIAGQVQTTFPSQARLATATGLPVIGSISELVSAADRALRRQRLKWLAGAGGALAGAYAVLMLVEFWQRSTVA
ncbi:XrtA system polysaccharide chain length determinant [Allosphingosinicella indica]|uniref:Polysaccharide chain length determinant protein, PEP-CTERM locus subfamily n=1 Tax=Allosphingosinicella indica TaxID=941907 RepID=A0A1X7GW05_9SPHN|nr:XrtA system polysaccharide chain length determinant [Allosphingosinicella indica]SMF75386.1 polysaccharide chain length determinant protein, PEP-CTERM locus subfamily [Allosphingosinicella indica]